MQPSENVLPTWHIIGKFEAGKNNNKGWFKMCNFKVVAEHTKKKNTWHFPYRIEQRVAESLIVAPETLVKVALNMISQNKKMQQWWSRCQCCRLRFEASQREKNAWISRSLLSLMSSERKLPRWTAYRSHQIQSQPHRNLLQYPSCFVFFVSIKFLGPFRQLLYMCVCL